MESTMRRHFLLNKIVIAVIMALGLAAPRASAQEANAPIGFDALTLTVEIAGRRFLSLEPIPMRLSLENRTGQPIVGHTLLRFASGRARLLVRPEGAEAYSVDDLSALSPPIRVNGHAIQPGERHEATDLLALGLDKIFPAPGRYQIHIVIAGPDQNRSVELRSNAISIQIDAPTGLDLAARTFIESTGAARHFLSGLSDDKLDPDFEQFAAQFADTVYGGYANLILGGRKLARGEYDRARTCLSRAAANANSWVASEATNRLKRLPRQ